MATEKSIEQHSRHKARAKKEEEVRNRCGLLALPSFVVVHHIDGNPLNNDLANLALRRRSDHTRYHSKISECWGRPSKSLSCCLKELETQLVLYNHGL